MLLVWRAGPQVMFVQQKDTGATESLKQLAEDVASLEKKIAAVESDPQLAQLAAAHVDIDEAVLRETAKLHADDAENLRLWHEFLDLAV